MNFVDILFILFHIFIFVPFVGKTKGCNYFECWIVGAIVHAIAAILFGIFALIFWGLDSLGIIEVLI